RVVAYGPGGSAWSGIRDDPADPAAGPGRGCTATREGAADADAVVVRHARSFGSSQGEAREKDRRHEGEASGDHAAAWRSFLAASTWRPSVSRSGRFMSLRTTGKNSFSSSVTWMFTRSTS